MSTTATTAAIVSIFSKRFIPPGTNVMVFKKYFRHRKLAENWRFLHKLTASFCQNLIRTLGFEKNSNFFRRKWQKIVFITLTPGKNHFRHQRRDSAGVARLQMFFSNQIPNLGKFWRDLQWKKLVNFMTLWSIVRPFGIGILLLYGIFYGSWVYFPRLVRCTQKIWQPWIRQAVSK
jgi:hypothetical protein